MRKEIKERIKQADNMENKEREGRNDKRNKGERKE